MSAILFECPSCASTLRTSNPSLQGKKIRCPKCSEPCPVPKSQIPEPEPALVGSETSSPNLTESSPSQPAENHIPFQPSLTEDSFDTNRATEKWDEPLACGIEGPPDSEEESNPDPVSHTGGVSPMEPNYSTSEPMMEETSYEFLPPAPNMTKSGMILSTVLFVVLATLISLAGYALVNLDLSRVQSKATSSLTPDAQTQSAPLQ